MTRVQFDYLNYQHFGNRHPNAHRGEYSGFGFDYEGLAQIMGEGDPPDVFVMGEGDRAEFNGGEGGYEAARALRAVTGRPYVPLFGGLPRQTGPLAPIIFFDPQTISVFRWYDHRLLGFLERNRNLLVATLPGSDEEFEIVAVHLDNNNGKTRLDDAVELVRGARGTRRVVLGDFNGTQSGPQWEAGDFDIPGRLTSRSRWGKAVFRHGPRQDGPYEEDTQALDLMLGWWDEDTGHRVGGAGYYDVAELEGNHTPTQMEVPWGRKPRNIDKILVTDPFKDAVVPGSYRVFEPKDPERPKSDHKRVSVTLEV